jgi:DME family drug/metabolite transporter
MGMVAGAIFGLASAVLYTMANIALRHCAGIDPFLVSAVKAAPTVLVLGPFLGWMLARGEIVATSPRMVPRFIAAALVGQFVGNAAFQVSLGMIGLAAVLGRVVLHEPVRLRTAIAMLVLIASVVVLSFPSNPDLREATSAAIQPGASSSKLWIGSMYAAASGAAYALFGVVMRQALTGGLSAPLTMFISGAVGTISLWSVTFVRLGLESLTLVDPRDWAIMLTAGTLNFTAFVSLASALKSLPVVAVNLINATQVAMAAVAGIFLFAEPVTATLLTGIALTMLGLGILAGRRRRPTQPAV